MKIVHLWKILGGDFYEHVTLNNLRMMLLAIKGLHVTPDAEFGEGTKDFIDLAKVGEKEQGFTYLGIFSQQGDLHLRQDEISKSVKIFKSFIQNRMLYEQKILIDKKDNRDKV
jgi:hypothetical protein